MKTALSILGVIIILIAGYYLFMQPTVSEPTDSTPTMGMPAPGNEGDYPEPSSKLDINAICTGALAYMSFANGAEADAWVAACVRGEHPEAIDQWKQMNGITDDRAI